VADALDIYTQRLTRPLALGRMSAPSLSWLALVPSIETSHLSLSLEIVKFLAKKPWSANPLLGERRDCADSGQKKGKPQGGVTVRVWAKNGWRRGRWWNGTVKAVQIDWSGTLSSICIDSSMRS
jgi:hypothetical protein